MGEDRLTQLADEVHRAVVAAVRRIQVDQELDVQASHLPLQDVGDDLTFVLLVLPLSAGDVWTAEEETDDAARIYSFTSRHAGALSCDNNTTSETVCVSCN